MFISWTFREHEISRIAKNNSQGIIFRNNFVAEGIFLGENRQNICHQKSTTFSTPPPPKNFKMSSPWTSWTALVLVWVPPSCGRHVQESMVGQHLPFNSLFYAVVSWSAADAAIEGEVQTCLEELQAKATREGSTKMKLIHIKHGGGKLSQFQHLRKAFEDLGSTQGSRLSITLSIFLRQKNSK